MRPWLVTVLVGCACFVGGGITYKYTQPARVVEREKVVIKTVEVEKVVDRIVEVQGPVRETTRTVTTPGPMGPTITVEKIVEKEKVVIQTVHTGDSSTNIDSSTDKSKVTDARAWFALEGGAYWAPANGSWAYNAGVQFRVGPVWVGAAGLKADTWYLGPTARFEF